MKGKKSAKRKKPTKATIRARVEEVLLILLEGAEPWDVLHYVSAKQEKGEPPWTVAPGDKPLCERQIRRYCQRADREIQESIRTDRKKLIRRHVAKRRNLYAKAYSAGDYRAALAALRDEAEMLNLYPPKETKLKGDKKNPFTMDLTSDGKPIQNRDALTAADVAAAAALVAAANLGVSGNGPEQSVHPPNPARKATAVPTSQ